MRKTARQEKRSIAGKLANQECAGQLCKQFQSEYKLTRSTENSMSRAQAIITCFLFLIVFYINDYTSQASTDARFPPFAGEPTFSVFNCISSVVCLFRFRYLCRYGMNFKFTCLDVERLTQIALLRAFQTVRSLLLVCLSRRVLCGLSALWCDVCHVVWRVINDSMSIDCFGCPRFAVWQP